MSGLIFRLLSAILWGWHPPLILRVSLHAILCNIVLFVNLLKKLSCFIKKSLMAQLRAFPPWEIVRISMFYAHCFWLGDKIPQSPPSCAYDPGLTLFMSPPCNAVKLQGVDLRPSVVIMGGGGDKVSKYFGLGGGREWTPLCMEGELKKLTSVVLSEIQYKNMLWVIYWWWGVCP